MKKALLGVLGLAVVAAVGVYLFRAPVMNTALESMLAEMFVPADTDSFNPGLNAGDSFPPLLAAHQGQNLTDMGEFISDKGMIFIANRSVDW
jgi:hypothetical protein